MLYSFDIFDTLLTRKTATPKGIFSIIQTIILNCVEYSQLPEYLKSNFYSIRIKAELYARRYLTDSEETTLDQIYSVICKNYSLTDEQKDALLRLECETEEKFIVGIPETIDKIKMHLNKGERVILISDMYLPVELIQKILVNIDPIFSVIPLYLSSDVGLKKTTGNIYRYIQKQEACKYSEWIHTGDNLYQDILIPKTLGIQTIRYKSPQYFGYERELINKREDSSILQCAIGVARYLRLINTSNPQMANIAAIGASLFYPYVSWLLSHAQHNNLSDLYFISRDGYILKIIADGIIREKKIPIKTHYLYGSRDAWRVPVDFKDALRLYEPKGTRLSSVRELSEKIGIDYSLISNLLPMQYLNNKILSENEFDEVFKILENDVKVSKLIQEIWGEKKKNIIAYLQQEIDFSSNAFALVDIGGTGLTIESLQQMLSSVSQVPLKTYYLSVTGNAKLIKSLNHQNRYFWYGVLQSRLLLEVMCRAPHNKCISYHFDGLNIKPVFESDNDDISELFGNYFDIVSQFSEEFARTCPTSDLNNDSYIIFEACYKYLTSKPNREIIHTLGDIPFEYDFHSGKVISFAPKIGVLTFLIEVVRYRKYGHFTQTSNLAYSLWRGWYPLPIIGYFIYWIRKYIPDISYDKLIRFVHLK